MFELSCGKYIPTADDRKTINNCIDCPAGKETTGAGEADCSPCPSGKFSNGSGFLCQFCPTGWYTPDNTSCDFCPLGQSNNGTACGDCPEGK